MPVRYHLPVLFLILLLPGLMASAQSTDSLLNVEWVLRSIEIDNGTRDTVIESAPRLTLKDSNKASGSTGCKEWRATYALYGSDSIRFSGYYDFVGGQFCRYEVWLRIALTNANRYKLDGNYLSIYYSTPDSSGVFTFSRMYPGVRLVNMIPGTPASGIALYSDQYAAPIVDSIASYSTTWMRPLMFGPHVLSTVLRTGGTPITLTENSVDAVTGSLYNLVLLGSSVQSPDPLLLAWQHPDPDSRSAEKNSAYVRVLTGSPGIQIDTVWIEDIGDSVLAAFTLPTYKNVSEYRQIQEGLYRLKFRLRGDTSVVSFSGFLEHHTVTTFILQKEGTSVNAFALFDFISGGKFDYNSSSYREPLWLEKLRRTGTRAGAFRIAGLVGAAEPVRYRMRFNEDPYLYPHYGPDTLGFRDASAYYHDLADTFRLSTQQKDWIINTTPDSLATLFVVGQGQYYWQNQWGTVLHTPLMQNVPSGEARLRFLHALYGADSLDLQIRYSDSSVTRLSGVKASASTPYVNVPSGAMAVTVYPAGGATPLLDVEGVLPSGYFTLIAAGHISDSTLSMSLLDDGDVGAQKPMTLLQPRAARIGWFRAVNVVIGGALLCAQLESGDSVCLPYRMSSSIYQNPINQSPGQFQLDWNGRTDLAGTVTLPDTLTTLYTLGDVPTTTTKYLQTPLQKPVPQGSSMLRILNAVYGTAAFDVEVFPDNSDRISSKNMMFGDVTDYRLIPVARIGILLFRSDTREIVRNIELPDNVAEIFPEGGYATMILTGSSASPDIALFNESDPSGQLLPFFTYTLSVDDRPMPGDQVTIAPNPAGTSVTLTYVSARTEPVSIEVVDARGAIRYRQQEEASAGTRSLRLSTERLAAGIYSVVVRGASGTVYGSERMVIVR